MTTQFEADRVIFPDSRRHYYRYLANLMALQGVGIRSENEYGTIAQCPKEPRTYTQQLQLLPNRFLLSFRPNRPHGSGSMARILLRRGRAHARRPNLWTG